MHLPSEPESESVAKGLAIMHDMVESGGEARDLLPQQLPYLQALFEDETGLGTYCFSYWICGCKDMTPGLHGEMCELVAQWGKCVAADGSMEERPPLDDDLDSWRRLMILVPRDCFKSTVLTRSGALWKATKNPDATVGIFNEAEDNVKKWLGTIVNIVENSQLYHRLWPHLLPRGVHYLDKEKGTTRNRSWKWGESGILFVREQHNVAELTFEPFGIGGAHTGKHFTHKIYDDIIGEKSATSQAIMEDAIHFVEHGREIERPAGKGAELICATRWGYHDVYSWMLKHWPHEYKVYQRSLLEDPRTREPDIVSGKSIFAVRHTEKWARDANEKLHFKFMAQYMNLPMAGRETSFDPEWVRFGACDSDDEEPQFEIEPTFYDPEVVHADLRDTEKAPRTTPLSWMEKAILVDPSPTIQAERTREPRARNGVVVVGMDPWGRRYVLEAVALRDDPTTVLDKVVDLARRWRVRRVGIEEVNFSKIYGPLWLTIMHYRHPDVDLAFFPLKPRGRDKDTRIMGMSAPHRAGFWYYNRGFTGHSVQELLEYPSGETRDLIDAQAYVDDDEQPPIGRPLTFTEIEFVDRRSTTHDRGLCGYGF